MKKTIGFILLLFMLFVDGMNAQTKDNYPANYARAPRFKALIYYTTYAEEAHVQFAEQATDFFKKLNYGDGFILDITTDFSDYTYDKLKDYQVVVMLNASPNTPQSRRAFEEYMDVFAEFPNIPAVFCYHFSQTLYTTLLSRTQSPKYRVTHNSRPCQT